MEVFSSPPSREAMFREVQRFFELLKQGDTSAAQAIVAHRFDDWPHQLRSLWQDLVIPWLEDRGENADVDDDVSWRDTDWLKRIAIEPEPHGDDSSFYVNLLYDGVVTDVSADFDLTKTDAGYVVTRVTMRRA